MGFSLLDLSFLGISCMYSVGRVYHFKVYRSGFNNEYGLSCRAFGAGGWPSRSMANVFHIVQGQGQ